MNDLGDMSTARELQVVAIGMGRKYRALMTSSDGKETKAEIGILAESAMFGRIPH